MAQKIAWEHLSRESGRLASKKADARSPGLQAIDHGSVPLLLASPGAPGSVPHVDDFNCISNEMIEYLVRITSNHFLTHISFVCRRRCFGPLRDELSSRIDRSCYVTGSVWIPFVEISVNFFDIPLRLWSEAKLHKTPIFFQNASISSSSTNSPRSACARPSWTSSHSSSVIVTQLPLRIASISRAISTRCS